MKKTKIITDVILGFILVVEMIIYLFWAIPFIGRYEPTMDPLPEILWRVFLDGPALTLAAWGLLQAAYGASRSTGQGIYWWSMLTLCGLFVSLYCWSVITYTPPSLPVSLDPHQIVVVIGGTCFTIWSIICLIIWIISRIIKLFAKKNDEDF